MALRTIRRSFAGLIALGLGVVAASPAVAEEAKPAAPTGALTCSTGTLFAGNPSYDGQPNDRITPGTGMKADRPFKWQNLLFVGNTLYSRDAGELWSVDTAAANPVMNRVAGKNPTGSKYTFTAGPCASARFGWIKGFAAMPDGSLLVVDGLANAVLKVKDPTSASCAVEYYAGTKTPVAELDPYKVPNSGDVDGAGATAKFTNIGPIVTDDAGNAFVYDSSTRKIKKIANDANHTVSTLGAKIEKPYTIRNLTRIGTKLYGVGDDSSKASIVEVDTGTGAARLVVEGKGDVFKPLDPYKSATLHGITTDGKNLIVSGLGYIWHVTPAGKVTHIAGDGTSYIDFPKSGYDPKGAQPAMKMQLPGARAAASPDQEIGSFEFITWNKGAIYTRGSKATAAWVNRIACQ
jgi:hypothetical protein